MEGVLLTGGAGYIGAHTAVALITAGYRVLIFDNFSNSTPGVIARLGEITGSEVNWMRGDVRDKEAVYRAVRAYHCTAVIHFAGKKAVAESVAQPLIYYENNVCGTAALLQAMRQAKVYTLVFSSSATVYGQPQDLPLKEDHPLTPVNPYGQTKLVIERLLADLYHAEPHDWRIAILRYFNPVGAHPSGRIGEDPRGIPNNLMPCLTQVAIGRLPVLRIFGQDYPTPDGTGVRDFIHVMDLAEGHVAALRSLKAPQCEVYNLGTGRGVSVLELVRTFESVNGVTIPYAVTERRPGDVAACWADPSKAEALLGWRARRGLAEMCADAWRWQRQNPEGYGELQEPQ